MDGKDLCQTPYPNSGSHVDMFNLKQPRYQPGHTNIAMNRGESNNVANMSNSSFAADNTSNSSVGYRQGTFVRNKGVASAHERLGNSAMANMQAQQQHHQPQINPSNNRNTNTNANLNALVRHQAPNQYGSNENLQMASHGKTTPLPYRVPVQQQQQQQQSQAQLINMQQGQRAYLQRHHQSHDPSSQQLQLDAASRTIDPRSQLQYQNYSYQSNYNRNIPSYHSSHQQLQQRRKTNDTTLAGNDGNNASSGTGGSYMDNSGGIHTGQYRNRQIASETSVNVNPQYHQIESNQPGKAQQQQQQSAMPSQHVASPILSPNYGRNDGISNIPTKSNPIQQQSLQTYAIQAQQLKLQTQQIDNRSILQRSLAQSGPKQTSQQSYFRPNYQNTHISQSQRQQVIQVPITRHSTGTAQVLQHKASSGLGTGNSMIQPSMTSVLEGQSRPTRHSPVNSMANSNNQATVFKQRTPALLNQSSGPSPSLKHQNTMSATVTQHDDQLARSDSSPYLRGDVSSRRPGKNVPGSLNVGNDLTDASQLDDILSDLLDPPIGLSPVSQSSRNTPRAVSPVGYEKVDHLYKLYNNKKQKAFLDELLSLRQAQGNPVERVPIMNKQLLDLYNLYKYVKDLGGSTEVTEKKLWKEVATSMGFESSVMIINALFTHYVHYILPYECKNDKDGIDVKIETEYLRGIKKKNYDDENVDQSTPTRNTYSPQNSKATTKSNKEILNDKELTDTVVDLADFVNSDDFDFNFDLPDYILSHEHEASNSSESANVSKPPNSRAHELKSPGHKAVPSSSPAARPAYMSSAPCPQSYDNASTNNANSWNEKSSLETFNNGAKNQLVANNPNAYPVASQGQRSGPGVALSAASLKQSYLNNNNDTRSEVTNRYEQNRITQKAVISRSKENIIVENTKVTLRERRKKTAHELGPVEAWRLLMSLKSGLLIESTWALDTLNILLEDNQTVGYFDLARLPGLLDAILDHYITSLSIIFKSVRDIKSNDIKVDRLVQQKIDILIQSELEELSYIQHSLSNLNTPKLDKMLVLENKRCKLSSSFSDINMSNLNESDQATLFQEITQNGDLLKNGDTEMMDIEGENDLANHSPGSSDRESMVQSIEYRRSANLQECCLYTQSESDDEASRRCICISNIFRSLSFIVGNDVIMCKHLRLLHTLSQMLMLKDSNSSKWWWNCLQVIRQNTLVVFSNLSGQLDVTLLPDDLSRPIIEALIYWCVCKCAEAVDVFPPSANAPGLSMEKLALESLAKISILKNNQNTLSSIISPALAQQLSACLVELVSNRMHVSSREFAVVLISNFFRSEKAFCEECYSNTCLSSLIRFIEDHVSIVTVRLSTRKISNEQRIDHEHLGGTSNYILCCAAEAIAALARSIENKEHFLPYIDRILNLTMSRNLVSKVINILAQALHDGSM